jgi:nucleotide-binding universal stress UspA family protein
VKKMAMKNILVPVDFSHASEVALRYTAELARCLKATIRLLHVHTPVVSRHNPMSFLITEERGQAERESLAKLHTLIESLGERYSSVKWEPLVESGTATDVILSLAKKDIDMIAMGTQGVSSLEKIFLGTNTAEIIEKSSCPVLAIPKSTKPYAPREILFATDYAPGDWESAKVLTDMARMLDGTITYLHVTRADDEDDLDKERDEINEFTNEIKKRTNFERIKSKIISDNNVFMGLDSALQDSTVDLLCLSTRKRSLIEKLYDPSVTRQMAIYTQVPLLAFKV